MLDLRRFASGIFSDAYRRVMAAAEGVGERKPPYTPTVRERIVRCIWFDQTLKADRLRTDDGRKLRVLSPGWWNLEAGPDFRNAALRFANGPVVKGDVEVHLLSSLWRAHGHHRDPAYNGVILHVVMRNDIGSPTVQTAAGARVPQLALEAYLATPLPKLLEQVDPSEYPESAEASIGPCHGLLADGVVTMEWMAEFLGHAGDRRIAAKAQRLAGRDADDDQLLYEAIAEGLGYKRNRAPALEVARRLPLGAIRARLAGRRDTLVAVEALVFGIAGLLPPLRIDACYDEAAWEHAQRLRSLWAELGRDLADEALDRDQWTFEGTRPTNFPSRRLAALAALVARYLDRGLSAAVREAVAPAEGALSPREVKRRKAALLEVFLSLRHPFWDTRTSFAACPLKRPVRLVGPDRAHTIIINAVFPVLLHRARRSGDRQLEETLHRLYVAWPKLPSTQVTRQVAARLFGRPDTEVAILRRARQQQGLYQLHADFCDSDRSTCQRCPLVRLLRSAGGR